VSGHKNDPKPADYLRVGPTPCTRCDRCDSDEYLCNVYDGEVICDNCCEKAYERQQERLMEDGGPDTSREDQQLRDAGRGHLVRP